LAGISLPLKSIAIAATDGLEEIFGRRLDGIAGAELFRGYTVEVDYDARILRFYEPGSYVYQGSGETLPLTLSGGRPFVKATVTVAGIGPIEGKFILDLGDNQSLRLNSPFVRKHRILSVEQKTIKNVAHGIAGGAPELLGRVDSFELGRTVLRGPVAAFSTATRGSTSASGYDGVLGNEIFRRFKIIFDYSRSRMILEPGAALGEPFEVDMLGVSWLAKGANFSTFEVDDVKEGSAAAEAGLLAGDIVVSIDGRAAAGFSLDEIKEMFRRNGTEYAIEIKRRDQLLKVKVKTRRLI
jgi:membrane-associated protease RseP (regulator of RpoE activity)